MDPRCSPIRSSALAPDYRVITWDERGFGQTEFDGEPFTYWDSADDCLGLLDHLGIERAVVGGMSQGGFVSLRVALPAPERVRGLILLDTQAGVEDPAIVAGYDQMRDMWLTVGPVDELADNVANIIIGDPAVNPFWVAKWQARPKELFAAALRHADDPRRRHRPARRDHLSRARDPRHRGHRDHDGSGRGAGGGPVRCGTGGQGRRRARRQPHEPRPGERGDRRVPRSRSATDRWRCRSSASPGFPRSSRAATSPALVVEAASASGEPVRGPRHRGGDVEDRVEGRGLCDRARRRRAVGVRRIVGGDGGTRMPASSRSCCASHVASSARSARC